MAFANRRVRSYSYASQPSSPSEGPVSLPTPATPTNTPMTAGQSPTQTHNSSPLTVAPSNTPASNLDSGIASPTGKGDTVKFHPPDFLKAHHFQSLLLRITVPHTSSNTYSLSGDTTIHTEEAVMTHLGERLAALNLARVKESGITTAEKEILEENIPKSPDNDYYEIRTVPGKGYGCLAIKSIKCGTRILADDSLLVVPKPDYFKEDIEAAFDKLSLVDQALYFTLHSAHGQDPKNWPKHIHESVGDRERCRIQEQHNARVGKEPSLISIFQTNCMEKEGGAAVFPHAARFNHSCNPNACFSWNAAIQKETIHAMRDIEKDEQITVAYCDMTHDKATRRWELKHYGFFCDCPACSGDDSNPASFAAKSAARRFRLMELDDEFRGKRGPYLEIGAKDEGLGLKLLEYARLLMEEGDNTIRLANTYLDIALICERYGDLEHARVGSLRALKVKLDCHGSDFPDVKNYRMVVRRIKEKIEMENIRTAKSVN